jgi:hypothetical protein
VPEQAFTRFIRNQTDSYYLSKKGERGERKMNKITSVLTIAVISTLMLSMVFVVPLASAAGATVWTDKADYTPGDTVTIFGSGFSADANVTVTITRPDSTMNTIFALTDGSGAFTCNYQLDGIEGNYTVTATDGTNTATTTFKDFIIFFMSTIYPSTATPSQTQTYTLTISNYYNNTFNIVLGSAVVTIPSSFTIVSSLSLTASGSKAWTATIVSGQIKLTAKTTSDTLTVGQHVSVSFSATAPATLGAYQWTTTAYTGLSWTGSLFTIVGSQPTVTVSPPTVSITITSTPVTGSGFVKIDNVVYATPNTFTWTPGDTHTLQALSPVSGGTGTQYVWLSWSDGGTQTHTYTVPGTSQTITANYKTQYNLTLTTSPSGVNAPTGAGWYDAGTDASISTAQYVDIVSGSSRYRFNGWTTADMTEITDSSATSTTVLMDKAKTVTANYVTQYYLTVVSLYDTPGGMGWYDTGTTAYATLTTGIVDIVSGSVRAVFTGWSGDASGTGLTSEAITMNGAKTAVANWEIQYYLTVVTDPSRLVPIPGEGWYDNCTWVRLTAPQYVPNATGLNGVRYRFSYWDVDGASRGAGVNPIDVHMNATHTATAHFVLQYLVTFDETGLDGTAFGTVVTVDSSAKTYSDLPFSTWVDSGTSVGYSYEAIVSSSTSGERFRLDSVAGPGSPITVVTPVIVTGDYVIQYYVTFTQSGVGSDFTGPVMAIDGTDYGRNGHSDWYDSGTSVTFSFYSPLVVTPDVKRYVFVSSSETSPLTVSGSETVIGTYETQYCLALATSPLGVNSPTGEGWYNPGAYASISTDQYVVIVPGVSRYSFNGWTTTDMSEITSPSLPSTTVLMDKGKTVTADYVVQYNPTASFTWSPPMPRATKTVTFDASTSTANTGMIVSYTWDFGDGNITTTTSPTITHSYANPKRYNVTLTVLNSVGLTGSVTKSVKITCLADVNMDGRVDIKDMAMVTAAFGSYPGHPRWNPNCDMNGDNRIDIWDVAYVSRYFGWWQDP